MAKTAMAPWLVACALALLTGCGTSTQALIDTARSTAAATSASAVPNNPKLAYLRTVVNGQVLYLVLGYNDERPEGTLQTWYSGRGEVVQLLNGRVVGTSGLSPDWTRVTTQGVPSWNQVLEQAAQGTLPTYQRQRDVMPGYRFGVADTLQLKAASAPAQVATDAALPATVRWFEEATLGGHLPPAVYAVRAQGSRADVVYSHQCLSSTLCLSFQPWVPSPRAP